MISITDQDPNETTPEYWSLSYTSPRQDWNWNSYNYIKEDGGSVVQQMLLSQNCDFLKKDSAKYCSTIFSVVDIPDNSRQWEATSVSEKFRNIDNIGVGYFSLYNFKYNKSLFIEFAWFSAIS